MKEKITMQKIRVVSEMIGQDVFIPVYNNAVEKFKKAKYNRNYLVNIQYDNNSKYHALIFACARCVLHNLPEGHFLRYNTVYTFIKRLQEEIGDVEVSYNLKGERKEEATSLTFGSKTDEEKEPLFKALCETCAKLLDIDLSEFEINYQDYL